MKEITIGFSYNNLIGSRLIRWWEKTPYSHVYIKWRLHQQERDIVYHAAHGLVHFQSFNNFLKTSKVYKEVVLNISDKSFKKLSEKCIDLAGEKYSYIELLQIFISDISKNKIIFKDQQGFICSELLAEILEDIFNFKFEKPLFLVKPVDIYNKLFN